MGLRVQRYNLLRTHTLVNDPQVKGNIPNADVFPKEQMLWDSHWALEPWDQYWEDDLPGVKNSKPYIQKSQTAVTNQDSTFKGLAHNFTFYASEHRNSSDWKVQVL